MQDAVPAAPRPPTAPAGPADEASARDGAERVRVAGRFFRIGDRKWRVKGFTYGPFAPNRHGEALPERPRLAEDFAHMRELGANALRVYHPPPEWMLDQALAHGLRVLIDVPWEKHRCFFEDWDAQETARKRVGRVARELGAHPAVFAISVANELPADVVRFYGAERVERFLGELVELAKSEAPDCLTTFVNFPSTEFLNPPGQDFCCFNVYVHDPEALGRYLDRAQHIAGDSPLLLGEYGLDSLREGTDGQARLVVRQIEEVHRRGLSGSFVFAYTDEWFTGGYQIEDWAFGVTRADRTEKPAARAVASAWSRVPPQGHPWVTSGLGRTGLPRVSVVVCTYNGAATLRGCLRSLLELEYPDYEVILVDDGSTDSTPEIAAEFPAVRVVRQSNRGLSTARNVGAEAATGEIVAYTDDDCVVDEDWLLYLVGAMLDQGVEAIGGPNLTPPQDGWIAKCVAASPGNPSHVMLDDRHAEHVPGCNMAFRRETLLGLGGFDPQFRQAGDDVDMCWRLLDADLAVGYAPAAMVWHHRRATVSAYLSQQRGYGRSEAMVHFKHPQRFGPFGNSRWQGVIYEGSANGWALLPEIVYHGRFGSAPFQTIYRQRSYGWWAVCLSLEWHLLALFVLVLALLVGGLAVVSGTMWAITLAIAARAGWKATLPRGAPFWSRLVVGYLHLMQPIVRGWSRQRQALQRRMPPVIDPDARDAERRVKRISISQSDLYWRSSQYRGREELLRELVSRVKESGWSGDYDNAWADWDLKLMCTPWHDATIRTATEELGWPERFTRARFELRPTVFNRALLGMAVAWTALALAAWRPEAALGGLVAGACLLVLDWSSRRRCRRSLSALLAEAGKRAGLEPVTATGEASRGATNRAPAAGGRKARGRATAL